MEAISTRFDRKHRTQQAAGESVLHTLKKRKEKKEQQEAEDEAQRKADRERPL